MIDAESADDRDQERAWGLNLLFTRLLPANKCLLQHVFRVRHATYHAVGDGKEQTSVLVKRGQADRRARIRVSSFGTTGSLFWFARQYFFPFDLRHFHE